MEDLTPEEPKSCFLEAERVCGSDCMAYNDDLSRVAVDVADKPFVRCHLLLNVHRVGKHAVVLTQDISQIKSKLDG